MDKRLLLVAEAETLLRALRYYLTSAGYLVEAVASNEAGLQNLATGTPALVICEDHPPQSDALQMVRQLRSSPLTKGVPILALSYAPYDAKGRALSAAGASRVIKRDTSPEDIGAIAAELLESRPAQPTSSKMANTVTVLGARGGSGKTMLATNLGVLLAERPGETAVLVDLNLEFGTAAMMLDLRPTYTLREIADASLSDVSDAVFDSYLLRHSSGLRVVPAVAQPGDSELIPDGAVARIIDRLRRLYDHVIVDARPSFRETMLDLWEHSDTLVVSCPPEVISVLLTRSLLDAFETVGLPADKVLLVLNQVAPKARLTPPQVEKGLGRSTVVVPYGGDQLYRAVDVGKVFVQERPNDSTAQVLRKLAATLVERHAAGNEVAAQAS
ncbi:MAG: AAA family ATPase [Candidatus Dormiibacterota bacterium]